ncbi:hypothetical protein ACFLZ9_00760 [Patescibacteria group bacterium]
MNERKCEPGCENFLFKDCPMGCERKCVRVNEDDVLDCNGPGSCVCPKVCDLGCHKYNYSNCPKGCNKECHSISGSLFGSLDCDGPGSCRCP